ncbi:MAG: DUF1264 domain-containing protein [Nitrospinaceae bacterium]
MTVANTIRVVFLILMLVIFSPVVVLADEPPPNPLRGYTIHVTAPHVMNGEVVGPFHHFCKPINSEVIQCILFESTDPNARMTEVEYMVSKKLARSVIPKWSHQQNWHDHKQEIATGRVAIMNPTDPKKQKELADYVSGTDGIIFHLWPKEAPIPDGTVAIAQSVGHWESLHGKIGEEVAKSAKVTVSKSHRLSPEDLKRIGITETQGSY